MEVWILQIFHDVSSSSIFTVYGKLAANEIQKKTVLFEFSCILRSCLPLKPLIFNTFTLVVRKFIINRNAVINNHFIGDNSAW